MASEGLLNLNFRKLTKLYVHFCRTAVKNTSQQHPWLFNCLINTHPVWISTTNRSLDLPWMKMNVDQFYRPFDLTPMRSNLQNNYIAYAKTELLGYFFFIGFCKTKQANARTNKVKLKRLIGPVVAYFLCTLFRFSHQLNTLSVFLPLRRSSAILVIPHLTSTSCGSAHVQSC